MNPNKLEQLLQEDESIYLEFKQDVDLSSNSGQAKFIRAVLALANSPIRVGYLILGVEDKTKKIIGIENVTEEQIQQILAEWCRPAIKCDFRMIEYQTKQLGILAIYPIRPPYTLTKSTSYDMSSDDPKKRKQVQLRPSQVFIRRGSIIQEATIDEVIEMAQRDTIDLADIASEMNRMTGWLEEIADTSGSHHQPDTHLHLDENFSRTVETTFVAMLTGAVLSTGWQLVPIPPILLALIAAFFITVTSSALRFTHFGIFRAIGISVLISMFLTVIFYSPQFSAFTDLTTNGLWPQLIVGILAGAIAGLVSQILIQGIISRFGG
jgi:hypothetical protein